MRDAKGRMDAHEVVMHEVDRDCVRVAQHRSINGLYAKRVTRVAAQSTNAFLPNAITLTLSINVTADQMDAAPANVDNCLLERKSAPETDADAEP
jgi:hypothetical protein